MGGHAAWLRTGTGVAHLDVCMCGHIWRSGAEKKVGQYEFATRIVFRINMSLAYGHTTGFSL